MITIHPYLNFNGNCFEAFTFYKTIFGGEFSYVGRFSEMPSEEGYYYGNLIDKFGIRWSINCPIESSE
jgi:uncharacterized glyoxalase superfamily protein PhnB